MSVKLPMSPRTFNSKSSTFPFLQGKVLMIFTGPKKSHGTTQVSGEEPGGAGE